MLIPRQANDNNFSILASTIYTLVFLPFSKTIIDYATQICASRFSIHDNWLAFNASSVTTVPVMSPMC